MTDPPITENLNRQDKSGTERWRRVAPLVDRELLRTASLVLRQNHVSNSDSVLQPQELVSEFYLRLLRDNPRRWEDRKHFFSFAAAVMRTILIDLHRASKASKRPQAGLGRSLDGLVASDEPKQTDAAPSVEIRIALERLHLLCPRQAEVIDLHFFEGLSLAETAHRLNVNEKTVRRDWNAARAFLYAELGGGSGAENL